MSCTTEASPPCRALEEASIAQSMPRKSVCTDGGATEQVLDRIRDGFFLGKNLKLFACFEGELAQFAFRAPQQKGAPRLQGRRGSA